MCAQQATLAADVHNQIGEAPVWDAANQRLLWVDHVSGAIHELRSDGAGSWRESRASHLHQPVAAALPRASGGLVVLGDTEIFLLDSSGARRSFARIETGSRRIKLNDGKCDARGRLWASAFDVASVSETGLDRCPGLYRIDPDGVTHTLPVEASLANGLDWSPDSTRFYFADSVDRTVDVFDYDLERGTLANRRTLIRFEGRDGLPNGLAVDREGGVWVALTGGGAVRRYSPAGELLEAIRISITLVTSCAFGGPDGTDLFVTTRSGRLSSFALAAGVPQDRMTANGPGAGGLYVCRPGASGAPATPFAH
jgi:sugar lactone lactonase YvrE